MIVRDGTAVSFLIEFPSGHPDGNIVWELRNPTGTVIDSGSLTVPSDAVSINLPVAPGKNALVSPALTSWRDLSWSYTVGGATINGEVRYIIEARMPFGVSPAGVRNKLGIDDPIDLPDGEISLLPAYLSFQTTVTPLLLAGIDPTDRLTRDAIEAMAARALIPTMVVRIAKKEDSGTSSFQRQDIDWGMVGAYLDGVINDGIIAIVPSFDPTSTFPAIFILASPETDAITGSTNA